MLEIPLTSDGAQLFSMTIDTVKYDFRVLYNGRANPPNGLWAMDISFGEEELINGVALVGGVDLLSAYNLDLKNMWAINVNGTTEDANADNLGTDVKLFILTDEEVASI